MSAGPGLRPQTAETPQSPQPRLPFSHCANPHCATGWLHLWRSRRAPVFEGRWACSPGCMAEIVRGAVRSEAAMGSAAPYRHRIPLGLLLVDQGHITQEQLREAVRRQEKGADAGAQRLGQWLVESGILSETFLTRALALQWNCPVFSPGVCRAADMTPALPRLLAQALGAVPLRVLGGHTLCLAFSERIDRALAYAAERILGLRVSSGIVRDSEFAMAEAEFLAAPAPPARLIEISGTEALARLVASLVEAEKPLEARLARVHGFWWLRLWRRPPGGSGLPDCAEVEDILCAARGSLGGLE
jgi:Type II secretion system (T2SS), protein E, N-terminal domain